MKWEQPVATASERTELFHRFRALTSYPARITFTDPATAASVKIPGVLERVAATSLLLELELPVGNVTYSATVHLEILSKQALIRCHAAVSHSDGACRLTLDLPDQVEELQRRRHPRADVQLQAELQVAGGDDLLPVQVINLSAGGAACSSGVPHPVGTRILLHMHGTGLKPAALPARVVRCTPVDNDLWVLGVAFHTVNLAQEAKLAQYVATLIDGE